MIVHYLIYNQEYFKELVAPLTTQYTDILTRTDPLFKEDVDNEYRSIVLSVIADEVTKRLAVSMEEVMMIIEGLNLQEYLK